MHGNWRITLRFVDTDVELADYVDDHCAGERDEGFAFEPTADDAGRSNLSPRA